MIAWNYKLWGAAGAVLALGAAGCSQPAAPPEQSTAPAASAGGEGGEAAIGEGGGEHGEAGAASAYAGIDGPARTALRLQHLKGFLMVARRVAAADQPVEAGVLVSQGVLEVYDPAADQFGALDVAPVRAAGDDAGLAGAQMAAKVQRGIAAIDAAAAGLDYNHADVAARMVEISAGLYQNVVQGDFVDPIEYQHSFGAAIAARDVLASGERALKARNARAYNEALAELDRYIALWPSLSAPETPTPNQQIQVQASRVRLALSGLV